MRLKKIKQKKVENTGTEIAGKSDDIYTNDIIN